MTKLSISALLLSLNYLISGCGDSTIIDPTSGDCITEVTIDLDLYDKGPKDDVQLLSSAISGDCLMLSISASGCDGSTWTTAIYDQGLVAESSPEQRYLRISLDNREECDAVITKDITFDLSPIQIQNDGRLILNIQGSDESLLYNY